MKKGKKTLITDIRKQNLAMNAEFRKRIINEFYK
jgi:hypothetical protein